MRLLAVAVDARGSSTRGARVRRRRRAAPARQRGVRDGSGAEAGAGAARGAPRSARARRRAPRLPEPPRATRLAPQAVAAAASSEAALRLYRTETTLVATVAALPVGLERAARRAASRSRRVRGLDAGAARGREGDELRLNLAARAEARARRRRRRAPRRAGRRGARGADGQRLVARRRVAVDAGGGRGRPPRRDARDARRARAEGRLPRRRGRVHARAARAPTRRSPRRRCGR